MPDSEDTLQVVIWVPEGLSPRHWVHGCQFVEADFHLRRSPAGAANGGGPGQGGRAAVAAAGGRGAPDRPAADGADPAPRTGMRENTE